MHPAPLITLQSERLTLRPLTVDDTEAIATLAGHPDVAASTLNIPHPYPRVTAVAFITSARRRMTDGTAYVFAINRRGTERLIGCVGLTVDKTHAHGEIGYWLGVPYWGHGYTTEAARCVMAFGFDKLHLHRVYAGCFADNLASRRVLEKIGMQYEGTLRGHYRQGDQWKDRACYGLLRADYTAQSPPI